MIVPRRKVLIDYPDSDGKPIADNTLQFDWIAIIKWNAEAYLAEREDAFVAGDHLIYPVEGERTVRQAPDVYIAFGRPKGYRGSYKVWDEGGIFPQVIFEVWSPNNRYEEMQKKFEFYERYGVEEYYIVYPDFPAHLEGWLRREGVLVPIEQMNGHVSPLTGFRFALVQGDVRLFGPDGQLLRKPDEIARDLRAERARAERLAAKLRELGLDPDAA
jgi:Uma2 family endonuclease